MMVIIGKDNRDHESVFLKDNRERPSEGWAASSIRGACMNSAMGEQSSGRKRVNTPTALRLPDSVRGSNFL